MLEIFELPQGSPEWRECRRGLATASEFKTLIRTKGRGEDGGSITRKKYLHRLAAEIVTGEVVDTYENDHMARGHDMEAEARDLYAFLADEPLTNVGFIRDLVKGAGASPDSLVGDRGILEVKTALPDIVVAYILKGDFPPEHLAQSQGNLWIAERDWLDIEIYWPTMPRPFIKRIWRDESYIADLAKAVDAFNSELAETVDRVRSYGQPSGLGAALRASLDQPPHVLMAG